jgi:hypothetical protein
MKVYVKTTTSEGSEYNVWGRRVDYTRSFHVGPFDSTQEAVDWAIDAGYEGVEILEFEA